MITFTMKSNDGRDFFPLIPPKKLNKLLFYVVYSARGKKGEFFRFGGKNFSLEAHTSRRNFCK